MREPFWNGLVGRGEMRSSFLHGEAVRKVDIKGRTPDVAAAAKFCLVKPSLSVYSEYCSEGSMNVILTGLRTGAWKAIVV